MFTRIYIILSPPRFNFEASNNTDRQVSDKGTSIIHRTLNINVINTKTLLFTNFPCCIDSRYIEVDGLSDNSSIRTVRADLGNSLGRCCQGRCHD